MTKFDQNEPIHPIGVVAERTGLSPEVLRVWERRYGVVEPQRDTGGRRLYSDADLERLRLLARATAAGRSIGQLSELSRDELFELVRGDEAARRSATAPAPAAQAAYVEQALERVRNLDGEGLERLLRQAAFREGMPVFLESVVAPLFRRVGDEWHAGTLTPVQEHLASAVARPLLNQLRSVMLPSNTAPALVIATPAGERHEVGALLAAAVAAGEGWRVVYLGPDLPAEEIARAAAATGARLVAVSTVYAEDPEKLTAELRALRDRLPGDVSLLVGGGAAAELREEIERTGAIALEGLEELRALLGSRSPGAGTSASGRA